MSKIWVRDRLFKDFPANAPQIIKNHSRHVFFVTPGEAADHLDALGRIVLAGFVGRPRKAQRIAKLHEVHNVKKEFGEAEIDAAVRILQQEEKDRPS